MLLGMSVFLGSGHVSIWPNAEVGPANRFAIDLCRENADAMQNSRQFRDRILSKSKSCSRRFPDSFLVLVFAATPSEMALRSVLFFRIGKQNVEIIDV